MKKKIFLIIFHLAVLCCLAVCMLKFPEELVTLKTNLRQTIFSALNGIQTSSLDKFNSYESVSHTGNEWYQTNSLIRHAAGGVDGLTNTNSLEALDETLSAGIRIVEIDFLYTSDGHLICAHDWYTATLQDNPLSLNEFKQFRIYGKYTTLTAEDIIAYMAEFEDLYIVIDTKEENEVQVISDLITLCGADSTIPDRFVVQLYRSGMKQTLMELYPFHDENFLFTAYKFGVRNPAKIMQLCYDENISVITIPHESFSTEVIERFVEKGFIVFEHTVNRPDTALQALDRGVYGVYSDFLVPDDLRH